MLNFSLRDGFDYEKHVPEVRRRCKIHHSKLDAISYNSSSYASQSELKLDVP